MKSRLLVVFLALLFIPVWMRAGSSSEEEKVRQAILDHAVAFERNEFEAIAGFYAHDENFINIESGRVDVGWKSFSEDHVKPGLKALTNKSYRMSDIRVTVKGNVAWAFFKYHFEADMPGRHITSDGVGTKVFERRNGKWLIVQSHTTSAPKKNS